jgi:hypothetical protein
MLVCRFSWMEVCGSISHVFLSRSSHWSESWPIMIVHVVTIHIINHTIDGRRTYSSKWLYFVVIDVDLGNSMTAPKMIILYLDTHTTFLYFFLKHSKGSLRCYVITSSCFQIIQTINHQRFSKKACKVHTLLVWIPNTKYEEVGILY